MLEIINLFLYIALTIFIGLNILRLVTFRRPGACLGEELALSFGLGVGFISLEMLFFSFFNIKFNILCIIIPWAILPIFVNLLPKALPQGAAPASAAGFKTLTVFLSFGIIAELAYAFFRALVKPIESYDAVAIYAIKSKIFFLAKSIPAEYFKELAGIFPHPDYPLNIPLFQTFIYTALVSLNDQLIKIIYPLYFLAALALLYYAVRRFASHEYALLFTFILAGVPQFSAYAANAYLDLPLAYYSFASAVFLFMWLEDRGKIRFLAVSAVMAGLCGWTKNEGLMYCAVNILMIAIFARKETAGLIIYAAIVSAISLPWLWLKSIHHLANSDIGSLGAGLPNIWKQAYKLGPIAYEFQKQLLGPKKWNIFWVAALVAFILNFRCALTGIRRYVSVMLALIIAGYVFFYLVSPLDIRFFLSKTWARFLVQFLPIAVYWLALLLKEDIKI